MRRNVIIDELKKEQQKQRSKWAKGVYEIAIDRIEEMDSNQYITWYNLLNGALFAGLEENHKNIWSACKDYSWGGCYLIYDEDIANLLATHSEAYTKAGNLKDKPNKMEEWLDVQARAIYQAFRILVRNYKNIEVED